MKRAITLSGGGPAAGLHIGTLQKLQEVGITFDVWGLSCIGAWVGIVYQQFEKGNQAQQTYDFFKNHVFRDDVSYSRFPINAVFGTDWTTNMRAMNEFLFDPRNYQNLVLPNRMMDAMKETMAFFSDRTKWNEGDFNNWFLNSVMAVNPYTRWLTSMMYLSNVNGLTRVLYPESSFLKALNFDALDRTKHPDKPFMFFNAWNLNKQKLELFCNESTFKAKSGDQYKAITPASLCACSALPFVEQTVTMDGDTYCEGALIDTVNFFNLIEDHPDLSEIWVVRIVDAGQVRPPRNLTDALGNLCMLFAATVGEDDIKLFKYHVKFDNKWHGKVIEIQVDKNVNFDWTHSNLENGRKAGHHATEVALDKYKQEHGNWL